MLNRLTLPRILLIYIIALTIMSPQENLHASTLIQNDLINLAKAAVISEVNHKTLPSYPKTIPAKAVFITIESNGKVIGCRGALKPRCSYLEEEVVLTARAAAGHDPRYKPLTPNALNDFKVTVTIVDELIPVDSVNLLSPSDGLVLKSGTKTGVVLPYEGKDPKVRLKWAYKKAGVDPDTSCKLLVMKAERFRG